MDKRKVTRQDLQALARLGVVTTSEMAKALGVTSKQAVEFAHRLKERGALKSVRRGEYAVVPLEVDPRGFQPDPYLAVQKTLGSEYAFSHQSAASLLGAQENYRRTLHVSAPGVRSRRTRLGPWLVHVHRADPVDWGQSKMQTGRGLGAVSVTTPERTLMDLVAGSNKSRDYAEDLEVYLTLLPQVDPGKFRTLVLADERVSTRARVGHLTAQAGHDLHLKRQFQETLRDLAQSVASASTTYLGTHPGVESNRYDSRFHVVYPGREIG